LSELPPLSSLQHLSLGWLPNFRTSLLGYPSLRELALHGQVTASGIPEELGSLTQLRALALAYFDLPKVPDCVENLKELRTLYLPYSNFEKLPDWLPSLPNLKFLAIFGCKNLNPSQIADIVKQMPALNAIFLPFPFPDRKELQKLGFKTDRGNSSVMSRGDWEDPFGDIR
jgi:Leucine-rich repeat (LRR) protein